jgi:hypothetical protein
VLMQSLAEIRAPWKRASTRVSGADHHHGLELASHTNGNGHAASANGAENPDLVESA